MRPVHVQWSLVEVPSSLGEALVCSIHTCVCGKHLHNIPLLGTPTPHPHYTLSTSHPPTPHPSTAHPLHSTHLHIAFIRTFIDSITPMQPPSVLLKHHTFLLVSIFTATISHKCYTVQRSCLHNSPQSLYFIRRFHWLK